MSSAAFAPVEIIPVKLNAIPVATETLFGFLTGTAFTLPPESRSPSHRNAVHLPTGFPFGFHRFPHTDRRIAEFTFIDWKGGSETARQQKVFKDFFVLAEASTKKRRYLYFLGEAHAPKIFKRDTTCVNMLRRDATRREMFLAKYKSDMTVREYYKKHEGLVILEDLQKAAPIAGRIFERPSRGENF